MGILEGWVLSTIIGYGVSAFIGWLLVYLLKLTPNEKIKKYVGETMFQLGSACTLWLSKWKVTKKFWNKIIEPWFIDLIDNIIGHGLKEFIRGLRSD